MIKGLFLDKNEIELKTVNIEDNLSSYYELLHCDTIDIVSRKFGDKYFDIVCDDEGFFQPEIIPTAFNSKGEVMFVGNLLIFNSDFSKGTLESLSEEDINYIKENHYCLRVSHEDNQLVFHAGLNGIEY